MVSKKNLTPITAILTGPTASGKTALGIRVAESLGNIEIINGDSIAVYQGFNIGSAKPSQKEQDQIKHHLIDLKRPDDSFTAGDFTRAVHQTIEEIHSRNKRALIIGGTGFYLKALLYGLWGKEHSQDLKPTAELRDRLEALSKQELYDRLMKIDEKAALRISLNDHYRLVRAIELYELTGKTPTELKEEHPSEPDPQFRLIVIDREKSDLRKRIALRAKQMVDSGLVEETKALLLKYPKARGLTAVGYQQVQDYLNHVIPAGRPLQPGLAGLIDEITLATNQMVKRQRTWFRGQKHLESFLLDDQIEHCEKRLHEIYKT